MRSISDKMGRILVRSACKNVPDCLRESARCLRGSSTNVRTDSGPSFRDVGFQAATKLIATRGLSLRGNVVALYGWDSFYHGWKNDEQRFREGTFSFKKARKTGKRREFGFPRPQRDGCPSGFFAHAERGSLMGRRIGERLLNRRKRRLTANKDARERKEFPTSVGEYADKGRPGPVPRPQAQKAGGLRKRNFLRNCMLIRNSH